MQDKKALSIAALVSAIPAAVLTYFLVMVFVKFSDKMSGMMLVTAAITLLCCGAMLFIPVAAMVFGGRKTAAIGAAVADDTEAAGEKKAKTADVEEEPAATISDQTIELDEDALLADEDLDDFETFDDLDDDRK